LKNESQLGPLKEQAEVAKRYRSIRKKLKSIEINIKLNSIDKSAAGIRMRSRRQRTYRAL
jgi:chromosome segregation ATPase